MADRSRDGSAGRWLAVTVAAFLGLAAAYLAVVPPFEGHDVHAHFAAAQHYRTHSGLPTISAKTAEASFELVTQPPLYHILAAAAALPWPAEPAANLARANVNAYFGGPQAYRQSVTLPVQAPSAVGPAHMARLVSLLGGLLTLLGTWAIARCLVPAEPGLAASAAAIAAFNPFFLFLSTTVTNDALAAGLCAVALAAGFSAWLHGRRPVWWTLVGGLFGLAAVTKYSALLLALPLGLLWLLYARRAERGAGLLAAAAAEAGLAVLAGWWYGRSVLLYGELVPFRAMAGVLPGLYRDPPWSLGRTLANVPWLVSSFWGVFVALIAPAPYLLFTRAFMVVGLASTLVAVVRALRARSAELAAGLAVLTAWACVAAAAVLYWTRTVSFGEQARLGSIGISAFGVLMAAGWDAWMPDRFRARGHAALIALMTCLAVSLVPFLHGAYALPTAVAGEPAPDRPADAHYAAGMRVLGVDFPRGAAIDPGGSIPVRVYLSTDKVIDADYTMFLHLADDGQRLLYHYDGAPVGGRHPTRQWRPGSVFVDAFDVRSSDVPTDAALATLSLGFYPFEQPDRRLQAMDATGADIGDRIVLGRVRVHGKVPTAAAPPGSPVVEWAKGIALAAVSVQRDAAGGPTGVDLTWTTDRTQQADYTVFAQVLDADNRILAQVDSQPLGGSWPTSTWRSGDVITDALRWDSNPAGWRRLVVGLYGADGRRVPLTKPAGVFPDAAELASSP